MKYFYSHLIEIDTVTTKLDDLDLTEDQKKQLADLIDSTLHHEILDLIFSKLSDEDKILFLEHFKNDPSDKEIVKLLNDRVENIEEEITKTVKKVTTELHQDIEDAKRGGKD